MVVFLFNGFGFSFLGNVIIVLANFQINNTVLSKYCHSNLVEILKLFVNI